MDAEIYQELARVQDTHWWFVARREIVAAVVGRLELPAVSSARILEIGCGCGGNLGMLRHFGRTCGIELDEFARRHAAACTGIEILPGSLPGPLPVRPGSFDLVCLLDVLEHVEDDAAALAAAAALVRPGGHLLLTVPAYAWLFGAHDRSHHHFRRYTAGRLASLARSCGLTVRRAGYFNTLLFPLAAAVRLADRFLGNGTSTGTALPSPAINRVLQAIFTAEAPLVSRAFLPFGTSVIAVLAPPIQGAVP